MVPEGFANWATRAQQGLLCSLGRSIAVAPGCTAAQEKSHAPALLWDTAASKGLGTGDRFLQAEHPFRGSWPQLEEKASGSWGCWCRRQRCIPERSVPGGQRLPRDGLGTVGLQDLLSHTCHGAERAFSYFPNFLNVQPLSVYFKFLATESLRIQVERKVSSTGDWQ